MVIAVFCGSKKGSTPLFEDDATELGKLIAGNKMEIIYGGGGKGLMGAVADGALSMGGVVTGVIPEVLLKWESQHVGLTRLLITEGMHSRKKIMYERCDAAVVLPGGFGTLDELFEMLTWNQLQIHDKKIYLLNTANFYTHLMEHMNNMNAMGFLYEDLPSKIHLCETPEKIIDSLNEINQL
jgi:uncharacterized protein (TIGR00730 family)